MRKPAPLFIIVFGILFLSCSALAAESNCPCQRPTVGRYDLNVQVQRPANPSANWLYLFEIGTAVGAGLFESDTCTSHKDGALLNALADPKSTMRTGTEYANLPPPGRVPGLDYLLTGSVQAGAGGYSVTVWIETAVSREKVKSTSFNLAANFTLDQLTAGEKSAVAALGPLGKTISEWEASKRDSDKEVALGDSGEALTVDPVKTSLNREGWDLALTCSQQGSLVQGVNMRIFIYVVMFFSLTAVSVAQSDATIETQLLTILHKMYAAEKQHDLKFIRSYLSDDFAEVAGDGRVYHWKDIEDGFADMELREYKLSDCVTKLVTSDAAYMSCVMEVDASFKGAPLPRLFRVTWLWTRTKDRWTIRFEQATIVPTATKN